MIDDNIGLILGLFLKHLLRFCDLRPGNTDWDIYLFYVCDSDLGIHFCAVSFGDMFALAIPSLTSVKKVVLATS